MTEALKSKIGRASKKDVARLAGVSHMTVTRVLQNRSNVAPETRQKVLAACTELNYRVNLLASYLSTKRSYALGVVCPTLEHSYHQRFINSIEVAASKVGYHIIIIQLGPGDFAMERPDKLEFLLQRQVDGIIVGTQLNKLAARRLANENVPIVLTEQVQEGWTNVGTDDYPAAQEAVRYLIGMGHRDIVHLSGHLGDYNAGQRYKGYSQALADAGIELREELVAVTDYDLRSGYLAAAKLLSSSVRFSAIFAVTDYAAVGAMLAIHKSGLRIPEDISIVGFSGDVIGEYSIPPLTTVFQPVEQVGEQAVSLIMKQIDEPPAYPVRVLVPDRLIERESCAQGPYAPPTQLI